MRAVTRPTGGGYVAKENATGQDRQQGRFPHSAGGSWGERVEGWRHAFLGASCGGQNGTESSDARETPGMRAASHQRVGGCPTVGREFPAPGASTRSDPGEGKFRRG